MTCSPQLTALKSTREITGPKSIRPDEYFSSQHPARTFEFGDILHWKAFPMTIERNLRRLKSVPKQGDSVTSVLLDNHIQAVFEETKDCKSEYVLGPANAVLLDKSGETVNPLLIGHSYQEDSRLDTGLNGIINGINSLKAGCPGSIANGPSWVQSVKYREHKSGTNKMIAAVRHLFHILAMNKLSFGFIYTGQCMRFFKLSIYRNKFELMISPLVSVQDRTATLVALCAEAYLGNSGLKSLPPVEVLPMTVETPSVYPLSSYEEGSAGHIKWWVARKINRRKYKISFEAEHRNLFRVNGVFWIQGMIIEDGESANANSSLAKFADLILAPQDDSDLRHSTSMMIYLNNNKIKCVPQVLAYGYMHLFQVLALAPFGKPIVAKDVEEAFIEELMHHALSELHNNGVMLVEISLECFAFDARASPPVRVFGFPKAKLVRNVPSIARRQEHDMLRKVVAQGPHQLNPQSAQFS